MTKKDYILAARIIRDATHASPTARNDLQQAFADFFAADNPRFDRARWRAAVNDGVRVERPGTREKPL
jgi:hypothetical protein